MPATLLLADDSITMQRVIQLTFAGEDVTVVAVMDGEAARQRIDADPPDIVLVDVGMPKMDGYEVAAHVKRTPALKHIPVLLLTGAFEPLDEDRARASGCDGTLEKPIDPQHLIRRVKDLLAGHRTPDLWPQSAKVVEAPPPAPTVPLAMESQTPKAPPVAAPPEAPPATDAGDWEFQRGLDDLDSDFADLDNSAGGLDDEALTDFARDLNQHRAEPEPAGPGKGFGQWDLPAPPPQPEATPPASPPRAATAPLPPPAPVPEPLPEPAAVDDRGASGLSRVSIAGAFSALLAAEQAQPGRAGRPAAAPALSDAAVEEIVKRVLARMTDQTVRAIVLETAERLIKEEIEKIRGIGP